MTLGELKDLTITEEEYRDYLTARLRLSNPSAAKEIESVGLPFLFASGSELLRTFILNETGFMSELPDRLKVPDRGYAWYMFSQAVREIHVTKEEIRIVYETQDDYKLPFKRFYI